MRTLYFSKKNYLFGVFTLLLFLGGFSVSAQQIITEHNSGTLNENTNYKLNFDESSYTNVLDENGNKVFLKNQSLTQNTTQGDNATDAVSLSINLVFDASQFYVSSVLIYNESGYMQTANWNGTNPIVVNVPEGIYDIMTEFQPLASAMTHISIKEQQSVQGNTSVQLNTTDAVNYVAITTYNEKGEILQPEVAGGYIFFNRFLYFNPIESVTTSDFYMEFQPFGGDDPIWNFYINNVSARYSVIQSLMGASFAQGNYFSKYETLTGIQGSVSIENNPADWSYHTEMFQPTKVADSEVAPANFVASTYNGNLLVGWMTSFGGIINPGDEPFRGFLNNPLDGDPADLFVIPAIIDRYVSNSPTTGGISYFTKGNSVFSDGNGGVLYGSGDVSLNSHTTILDFVPFLANDYYLMDTNMFKLLPSHPKFSFDKSTTPSVILGNNVPITVTGFKSNSFTIANKGCYGETRESDYLANQIVVKQNGNVLFTGAYQDFGTFNLPTNGEIEIVLTDANTLVDQLQGINTTTITYNAAEADAPPTLQHLQFRNSDDQVTSILDSNVGATLRLAAGDFKYTTISGSDGYYDYEEGNNIAVSYSVYNQNDWRELGVTENPDYFQMPAFGNYYEASLESVTNADDNVWYDLKVISTDAAGNKQEQVISPAFKINHSLGFEDIVESNFVVYPNPFSEEINVVLPKNVTGDYTFKVTDLLGRTVYSKIQNDQSFSWNSSFLSKGVYILSIENIGSATSKKVIKM